MSEQIFNKIEKILTEQNADFRVVSHGSAKTSAEVALLRGTELGQGAKALCCVVKGFSVNPFTNEPMPKSQTMKAYVLAVLPADFQADLVTLATKIGATKASLASPSEVLALTDCVFGSVPPFSFDENLLVVADPSLLKRFEYIAFNAGLLDRSVILKTSDYARIVNPRLVEFAKTE